MKIIVLHLSVTDPIEFLDDPETRGVAALMSNGPHGLLGSHECGSPFQILRSVLAMSDWKSVFSALDTPELLDHLKEDDSLIGVDVAQAEPGETLEAALSAIDGEAVVVALSAIDASGNRAFVLTTTEGLPSIRVNEMRANDLVATILELAGLELGSSPALCDAQSFVPALTETAGAGAIDDEELVRERLRGLGYIA